MGLRYRRFLSKYAFRLFLCLVICQIVNLFIQYGTNWNEKGDSNIEINLNNIQIINVNVKYVNNNNNNNKSNTESFGKYVAISTSLEFEKDFYMFYLPMTCESWRRIGFEPIIIIVISGVNDLFVDLQTYNYKSEINSNKQIVAKLSRLQLKVIEYLNRLQLKVFYLKSFRNYEAQIGMLARLFIGYISNEYIANDNDYIILGDTDLIPINPQYYDFKNDSELITVWNAFCCQKFEYNNEIFREYPMSHIGMKKHMWRNILTFDSEFDVFLINSSFNSIGFDRSSIVRVINDFYGQNRFVINTDIGK